MIYMVNALEFQETNVPFSLKTNCRPKSRKLIGENNRADSSCPKQIKLVIAVCMEIAYHIIHNFAE